MFNIQEKKKQRNIDRALIARTYIATQCDADWEDMKGDEKKRLCAQCNLNVYNVSEMSTEEAAQLIRAGEGRLCLILYRRKDGTVITNDCPVGLRRLYSRLRICATFVIAMLVGIGAIDAAWGQGLVGAPVDSPGYGGQSSVADMPDKVSGGLDLVSWVQLNPQNTLFMAAGAVCAVRMLVLALRKRGSLLYIGATFSAVMIVVGLIAGFMR